MQFEPVKIALKDGRTAILRSPQIEDAADMLAYLQATTAQTRFVVREPDEAAQMTLEQEERFIRAQLDQERTVLLLGIIDGKLAGIAHLMPISGMRRMLHRCTLAVGLERAYWGIGLGRAMMCALLDAAMTLGYEQAELEVVTTNERAIGLYKSLGFEVCGTLPRNMKYADGSYADLYAMVRGL